MKEFKKVSASQIDKHQTCNRRWWFPYIYGLPHEPQADTAALGEAIHAGQEKFLRAETEDASVVHPLAKASLPLLRQLRGATAWRLGSRVLVEHNMSRALRNGVTFIGKIDVLDGTRIIDWKSGNPDYFKTAEDLRADTQMLVYAYEALVLTPGKEVTLAHFGIPTKKTRGGGTGGYVETTVTAPEVHAAWTRMQDYVDVMALDAKKENPLDVAANTGACMKYGRKCSYLDKCANLKSVKANPYAMSDSHKEETMPALPPAPNGRKVARKMGGTPPFKDPTWQQLYDSSPADGLDVFGKPDGSAAGAPATVAATVAVPVVEANRILPPEVTPPRYENRIDAIRAGIVTDANLKKPNVVVKFIARTPKGAVTDTIPEGNAAALLLDKVGFSDEQINSLPDEAFEKAVALVASGFVADDIEWDATPNTDSPTGQDYTNVRVKVDVRVEEPAPVVEAPKVEEPAATTRRSRTAAAAPVVEAPKAEEPAPVVAEPKRRGRPLGSKNKIKEPTAATAGAIAGETIGEVKREENTNQGVGTGTGLPSQVAGPLDASAARVAQLEDELERTKKDLADMTAKRDLAVSCVQAAIRDSGDDEAPRRLTLYVDILPEKGLDGARHLDEILAPLMAQVAEEWKDEKTKAPNPLTHYLLVPYNGGPSRLSAYLMANIGIVTGDVLVSSSSPCAAACLEVLRPVADRILRGVR